MKPLHAVNNGPVYKFTADQRITNIDAFREAGIPFARTHDSSFYANYGGEHTVDIIAVFPDFSKDVNDPSNYDFSLTDEYLKVINFAGVETFYRLGSKIEHWPIKYGTRVPADYQKWAEICEHIIRHYTEGWANGFNYKITYWEIWNEPDGAEDDAPLVDKKCWSGTRQQFFDFYEIAAKHLKKCFPHLKIGGPAVTGCENSWSKAFVPYCAEHNIPLDFFSWHHYQSDPMKFAKCMDFARKLLDENGFVNTESILNEWNYVTGWDNDNWINSLRTEKSLKGSSFISSVMLLSQYKPLDMLMYYDARPCAMNGMFNTDIVSDKLKGYYSFLMFNELYKLGEACNFCCDNEYIYGCSAGNDISKSVMFTYYKDLCKADSEHVAVTLENITADAKPVRIKIYLLDEHHNAELIREEIFTSNNGTIYMDVDLFTTVLIKICL